MSQFWTLTQCAEHLGVSPRYLGDIFREGEAPVPQPLGKAGNAYLWDPLAFKAGCRKLRAWIDGTTDRKEAKRAATLKAKEDALAARQAKFERELREHEERMAFFRQCERDNADEQDGRATRRGSTAILPSPGSR